MKTDGLKHDEKYKIFINKRFTNGQLVFTLEDVMGALCCAKRTFYHVNALSQFEGCVTTLKPSHNKVLYQIEKAVK